MKNFEELNAAIRRFVDEQIQRDVWVQTTAFKLARDDARSEALEEAASYLTKTAETIFGDYNGPDLLRRMTMEIRAMKDKP